MAGHPPSKPAGAGGDPSEVPGALPAESPAESPPDEIDAGVVVALCHVLGEAHYDRFIGELSATDDADQAAAVVRRWASRVLAAADRRRRRRPPEPLDSAEPAEAAASRGTPRG